MSSQKQQAGDGSAQYQVAGNLVVVQGVTEERAREIARDAARDAMDSLSSEAQAIGAERIEDFVDRLIPILQENDRIGALGDPAIQMALRRAQLGAAASGDETDHDMLAELIAARIDTAGDRQSTAGIERAVEVVDKLDPAALGALTVYTAVSSYTPIGGPLRPALASQDRLFAQFTEFALPAGDEWIDHLDILDLVRPSSGATLKPAAQFFVEGRPGFVSQGISNDDERLNAARQELLVLGVNLAPLEHELKADFTRLPINDLTSLRFPDYGVNPEALSRVTDLATEVFQVRNADPTLTEAFMGVWREFSTLEQIAGWWDRIPRYFNITAVGRVLVQANIKRLNRMRVVDLSLFESAG